MAASRWTAGRRSRDTATASRLKKQRAHRFIEEVANEVPGKAASVEAIGTLYQQRFHAFLRVAEAIVGDPELARDVVQEAFARAIRCRFDYRGEGTLDGWVWQTVVNAARNARRDRPPEHLPLQDVAGETASMNGRARDSQVGALVAALPERQRLVLFLRYYADLDYLGIAEALAIEPGTVGATLSHAHAAMRRALEEVPR
jgi:RNA polymerase sigma factor (sigma-70 family)